MNDQNPNNQAVPDETPTCPRCGAKLFTAGGMDFMRDVCVGKNRNGCFPCCCSDEECKNRRYYEFYMMTKRRTKIINIDPANLNR